MHKRRSGSVLFPSVSSGLGVILVAAAVILVAFLAYTAGNGIIYRFLFGANSSTELIQTSRSTIAAFSNTVFGNPLLNKILFFAFWMLVGLVVYMVLYGFIRGTSSAAEDINESHFLNTDRHETVRTFEIRTGIRSIALFGWIIYLVFFFKILFPFSILMTRIGVTDYPAFHAWLYGLSGLIILTSCLHIHVIFLRLIMLRTRLFDSNDVVG